MPLFRLGRKARSNWPGVVPHCRMIVLRNNGRRWKLRVAVARPQDLRQWRSLRSFLNRGLHGYAESVQSVAKNSSTTELYFQQRRSFVVHVNSTLVCDVAGQ